MANLLPILFPTLKTVPIQPNERVKMMRPGDHSAIQANYSPDPLLT